MSEQYKRVAKAINEVPNTKIEIKKSFKELKKILELLDKRSEEWWETPTIDTESQDAETQTFAARTEEKRTKAVGTQTSEDGQVTTEITRALDEDASSFKNIEGWIEERWPEEVFIVTTEEVGNPAKKDDVGDIALLVDKGQKEPSGSGLLKSMISIYPEIADIIPRLEDSTEYLRYGTQVETSRGATTKTSRYIFLVPCDSNKEGMWNPEAPYNAIEDLKAMVIVMEREKVYITAPNETSEDVMRKMLERVFRRSKVRVTFLRRKPTQTKTPATKKERPTTKTVGIKMEGKTFAEVLTTIRKEIDIKKVGVRIKNIKNDGKEGVRLFLTEGEEKIKAFEEEIRARVENAEVRREDRRRCLFIQGMDTATTEEE